MYFSELFGFSVYPKKQIDLIKLDGPFIDESYLIRNRHKYAENAYKSLSKCNLIISRDILILSQDDSLLTRDNQRFDAGLEHHIHNFELTYYPDKEYQILAIDHYVILNPLDEKTIKEFINRNPPANKELKNINL